MTYQEKTVAAVSTPPGKGGVAVIRISGTEALDVAERIFKTKSGSTVKSLPSRSAVYGQVHLDGAFIDDAILTVFRAPASFTGEDTAEISCHGGMLVTNKVLEACLCSGAYPAGKGEFTRRAYVSGKLSLSEAEAIADLLDAKTQSQLSLARGGVCGRLTREIDRIYSSLVSICASVYAVVDYPEEDLAEMSTEELIASLSDIELNIDKLCRGYHSAAVINKGIKTVICGAPNVGKSSVYNMLCGQDRAIVTDVEGTTRDTLNCEVELGSLLLELIDTAGIRKSTDKIEELGIERSRAALEEAELLFFVFDSSRELSAEDEEILSLAKQFPEKCSIALLNKSDLPRFINEDALKEVFSHTLYVSAKRSIGTEELCKLVQKLFLSDEIDVENDAMITNARQFASAKTALDAVKDAKKALLEGMPADMAACDVERAMQSLHEIDGQSVSEDVTSEIFSRFCVGK